MLWLTDLFIFYFNFGTEENGHFEFAKSLTAIWVVNPHYPHYNFEKNIVHLRHQPTDGPLRVFQRL